MSENQNIDRKDLKIQALLEKLNAQENHIADLRVALTLSEQQARELADQLTEIHQDQNSQKSPSEPEIVEGEVVPTPAEDE